MLVGSLALAVGIAIYDLTTREIDLSQTATQSQYAIYAADTGAECALYWDFKCQLSACTQSGAAQSAFATSSTFVAPTTGVVCNGKDVAAIGTPPASFVAPPTGWSAWSVVAPAGQGRATTTFYISFLPAKPYCVKVEVAKVGNPTVTTVTSHGYNTCQGGTGLRLERILQVSY